MLEFVPLLDMDRELSPEHMGSMQLYLLKFTDGRSVPCVPIGGEFMDGGDDVAALHGCVSLPLDLPPGWARGSSWELVGRVLVGARDAPLHFHQDLAGSTGS